MIPQPAGLVGDPITILAIISVAPLWSTAVIPLPLPEPPGSICINSVTSAPALGLNQVAVGALSLSTTYKKSPALVVVAGVPTTGSIGELGFCSPTSNCGAPILSVISTAPAVTAQLIAGLIQALVEGAKAVPIVATLQSLRAPLVARVKALNTGPPVAARAAVYPIKPILIAPRLPVSVPPTCLI